MKRLALLVLAVAALGFGGINLNVQGKSTDKAKEKAVVEFTESVKLVDVLLRGEYTIVHDEERMARGEPCTWVYRGKSEADADLVVSFHCIHVDRERAESFKVTLIPRRTPYSVPEITEIQFAGSRDGHKVPGV